MGKEVETPKHGLEVLSALLIAPFTVMCIVFAVAYTKQVEEIDIDLKFQFVAWIVMSLLMIAFGIYILVFRK